MVDYQIDFTKDPQGAYEFLKFIFRFTGWGKKDEPEVEITEITEIPADFDMTQEAIAEGECYRITLEIM